ncbi:hypothetical protein [Paraburkholderia terrae]
MNISFRLSVVTAALTLTACAETGAALQSLNNGLAQVNQAMAPSGGGTPSVFGPSLSVEQQGQMRDAIGASLASRDAGLRNMVSSAQPVLVAVMSKSACYHEWNASRVLSMYTSAQLGNGYIPAPFSSM